MPALFPLMLNAPCEVGSNTRIGIGAKISTTAAVARAVTLNADKPSIFVSVMLTDLVIVTCTSFGVPAARLVTVTPGFGSTLMQSDVAVVEQLPLVYVLVKPLFDAY